MAHGNLHEKPRRQESAGGEEKQHHPERDEEMARGKDFGERQPERLGYYRREESEDNGHKRDCTQEYDQSLHEKHSGDCPSVGSATFMDSYPFCPLREGGDDDEHIVERGDYEQCAAENPHYEVHPLYRRVAEICVANRFDMDI